MKTISDFLEVIKKDSELNIIIRESEHLQKDYRPRNRHHSKNSARTKAGIAMKHFWSSLDGINFRQVLESKYATELNNKNRSAIKDALQIYISEVISK